MRKRFLGGWTKVFSFSFRQHLTAKYITGTVLPAALLFILIPCVLLFMDKILTKEPAVEEVQSAETILIVDETASDLSNVYTALRSDGITVREESDASSVLAALGERDIALIISKTGEDSFRAAAVISDSSIVSEHEASVYAQGIASILRGSAASGYSSDLSDDTGKHDIEKVIVSRETDATEDIEDTYSISNIIKIIVSYIMVMLMYFLVLAYGQSTANAVVADKSNRLMDTLLLSADPAALMLGKTLAAAVTGLIQVTAWLGGIIGGFAAGAKLVRLIDPASTLGIIYFIESLPSIGSMFTLGGILLAICILAAGFVLYCALSAVGGALAGKPEDLSNANMLFSMILVVSFLLIMYGGTGGGGLISSAVWLQYVPFTAILTSPGRLLTGDMSILQGILSLFGIVLTALLIAVLAGRLCRLTAFRRGVSFKPKDIIKLLRS